MEKITRRSFVGVAALGAGMALAGCASSSNSASASASASAKSASASAAAASGSASASAAAATVKPVILVVSFGTSFNDSRQITIGAIENDIREAFPDYDVRRAFTAQIIIDKLKSRDGRVIDNVDDALQRCVKDGVKELIVQPTHLMHGFEYDDLVEAVNGVKDKFTKVVIAEPLLTTDDDYAKVIAAITDAMDKYVDDQTAIVFMGHGTEHESNSVYATLQDKLKAAGKDHYFITTVEAEPTFEDTIKAVKDAGFTKAVLRPLMVVAGDHANNDMADEEDPESLASMCKAEGIEVQSVIEGLGQLIDIDEIYVAHTKAAMK
ncbi:MAG: sirohydrochlorin cobaltochelatase [Eggerthellaceae bacterium]|nr:sirohydrochlorin cobaltochelatase [Eggerthellaceae bacterium]